MYYSTITNFRFKILILLFIFVLSSFHLRAQNDCDLLNRFTSFHGIRMGEKLPLKLKQYFEYSDLFSDSLFTLSRGDIAKRNMPDSLNSFFFFGDFFSYMTVFYTKSGKTFDIILQKDLVYNDSIDLVENKNPLFLINVTKEISSVFGNNYVTKNEKDEYGEYVFKTIWECDRIKIGLYLKYTNIKGRRSYYQLEIIDKKLEKLDKLDKYLN